MPTPFIVFEDISKSFNSKKVITRLTLSIYHNELFGIIGRSGAGKSTLLKLLIGFYSVDSGKILFQGRDISYNAAFIKQLVGFCGQENSFYPELTVLENLYYYGRLYCLDNKELFKREQELLGIVGLLHNKHTVASNLSGGMKRRLDFAISLVHQPPLLILDEPTTGLDPITERTIWDLIKDLTYNGISVIVISHMLEYVEKYCDTVGFLANGRILLTAAPYNLRKKYSHKDTFAEIFAHILEEYS